MNKHPEYEFSKETQEKLKGFKTYLEELGNGGNTIRQKLNYAGYFLKWMESESLQVGEIKYNDLLNFIDYCRLEGNSKKLTNNKLRGIRNYYEYLKTKDETIINPGTNLHLKGLSKKLPANIIEFTALEKLYQSFPPVGGQVPQLSTRDKRNKTILGLLIYQGITTEELHRLEPENLRLKEGKIYVPGNRKRNSRTLELKPFQILELQEYTNEVRPKLIKEKTSQLFISAEGNRDIKNSLYHMFRSIKKINPDIRNAKQIRASVITHWLKTHNLRQVQYMAGHKYVSSTERYQLNNIDKLQKKIEQFHPLK